MPRMLALLMLPLAASAAAQESAPDSVPEPAAESAPESAIIDSTNSGVLVAPKQERIPLEQFMVPLGCPPDSDAICIEGNRDEDEPEAPPEPGDRKRDAAAERKALSEMGSRLPTDCTAIGPAGGSGCAFKQYETYKEERELLEERYLPPEPE